MKILAISEHFRPRVGGTVSYVERTCEVLAQAGHQIELLIPGKGSQKWEDLGYEVKVIECDWPELGDPDRATRYQFARQCSEYALSAAKEKRVDVVHVLFGLFVNETLDTEGLRSIGIPCVTTIHNVPPQECARTWSGDGWVNRLKEKLRLRLVSVKNYKRLRVHDYSAWVVPSMITRDLLKRIRPDSRIEVIGHGYSQELIKATEICSSRRPKGGRALRLLTVGGWVPHKRQHLIPAIANLLRENQIDFVWDVVGPPKRITRYYDAIQSEILSRGLVDSVVVHGAVSFEQLVDFYKEANLYVQPSTEEGFCLTALDAAAVGLPVIGSPAGALPEICRMSGGALVPSNTSDVSRAIEHFLVADLWSDSHENAQSVQDKFTWMNAGAELERLYRELL